MISPGDLLYDREDDRLGWVIRYTSTSTITGQKTYLVEWAKGYTNSYYEWAVERFKAGMLDYASTNR